MARLGVSRSQVRRYEEAGRLKPSRDAANVCWFEPSEVEALVRERANAVPLRGDARFETEYCGLESAERDDELTEHSRELKRRELAIRERELADQERELAAREAARVRRDHEDLLHLHEERCGEARDMLVEMWRTRSLKSLHLLRAEELRTMLYVLVPMRAEDLEAVPTYTLASRIERELRARAVQVSRFG